MPSIRPLRMINLGPCSIWSHNQPWSVNVNYLLFATGRHLSEPTSNPRVWERDPFRHNVTTSRERLAVIAGIGVEFSTQSRGTFAGKALESDGPVLRVHTVINEVTGNRLKNTNVRCLVSIPDPLPRLVYRYLPCPALTTNYVTGYDLIKDALLVRQKPGTEVQRRPYSQYIRILAKEITPTYLVNGLQEASMVTLTRIEMHSDDIASFTFEAPTCSDVVPGQAAILDFKWFVSSMPYQHMSVNDDWVRTWAISGSSRWHSDNEDASAGAGPVRVSLTLTIRHKRGGVVSSALFAIAQRLSEFRPKLLEDARPLHLSVPLVGITGVFALPTEAGASVFVHGQGSSTCAGSRKLLWIAGGIGVTPFLAMLAGLRQKKKKGGASEAGDIVLVLSTREPEVLLPLVLRALEPMDDRFQEPDRHRGILAIHIFSRSPASLSLSMMATASPTMLAVKVTQHAGRLSKDTLRAVDIKDIEEREAYVCGPEGFERVAFDALKEMGIYFRKVRRK